MFSDDDVIPVGGALFAAPGEFDLSTYDDDLELILGEAINGTPLKCGQCGEPYVVADEVEDERLFRACPECVDAIE